MPILNIAGYKFITLDNLPALKATLHAHASSLELKGTILLSREGINVSLAGLETHLTQFIQHLHRDERFNDMRFHQTYSPKVPFRYLKVKIKKEIITLRQPCVDAVKERAGSISPQELKQWLDEKRDIVLLDTRNDYEYAEGSFKSAVTLPINDFGAFPNVLDDLPQDKPIVMFCTGGIRCEKAALYMQAQGFSNVLQLDSGILGYFAKMGGAHYEGNCFVFDERVSVTPELEPTH